MESSSSDAKEVSFNIYQYDAQLVIAFQADCESFFNKFSQCKSYSFGNFAKLWRETCFMSIFDGQEYILTLQAFIENCFFIVKKFLFSSDQYVQVGALYVLYALYYKQPFKKWVKIRLTQTETEKINQIVEFHKQNKRWEILFIYSKMRVDGAFHYCALVQPMGFDAKFSKRIDLASEEINVSLNYNPLEKFKHLLEQDIKELEETEREYKDLAKKYTEKCKELYVFPSDIGKELREGYAKLVEECVNENSEEEQDRVKEIKTKAMSNKNATYRADLPVVTGLDLDTSPK